MLIRFLLIFVIFCLITGCKQTFPSLSENEQSSQTQDEQKDLEDKSSQTQNKHDEKVLSKKGIKLIFNPVSVDELSSRNPKKNWKTIKKISLGKIQKQVPSLELYTEKENQQPFTDGNVYALIKFKDSVHFIGNVSPSYGFDEIDIKTISEEFGDLFLIAGIGTKFTGWTTIAYDVGEDKFVQFNTIGKPKMVELNKNNQEELVGISKGVHLNPPNVFVFRWVNDTLKVSNINESIGLKNGYVALEESDEKWLFKVGTLSQKKSHRYYHYKGEKLIRIE